MEAYARRMTGRASANGSDGGDADEELPFVEVEVEVDGERRSHEMLVATARPTSGPTTRPAGAPSGDIAGALLHVVEASAVPVITERSIDDPIAEMRQSFATGNYIVALELADLILAEDPGNADAIDCKQSCQILLDGV
jgi:hypothetical protein